MHFLKILYIAFDTKSSETGPGFESSQVHFPLDRRLFDAPLASYL